MLQDSSSKRSCRVFLTGEDERVRAPMVVGKRRGGVSSGSSSWRSIRGVRPGASQVDPHIMRKMVAGRVTHMGCWPGARPTPRSLARKLRMPALDRTWRCLRMVGLRAGRRLLARRAMRPRVCGRRSNRSVVEGGWRSRSTAEFVPMHAGARPSGCGHLPNRHRCGKVVCARTCCPASRLG